MVPVEVDDNGRVKIRAGDMATLAANSLESYFSSCGSVDALYLGRTPKTDKLCGAYPYGEGHLFARLDDNDKISFYLASTLKMEYWSDGDDDPSYAVGINAWKTDRVNLRPSEREYVFSLLAKRRDEKSRSSKAA
jgi:hypothetical protein